MADYDVLVIGGGPGGYAAALRAAEHGATVAVVEMGEPGGSCVNYSCIPTNILLSSVASFLDARELDVMGVFSAGETFNLGRANARKDALVRKLSDGIAAMLRMRKVSLIAGRAQFGSPYAVDVALADGSASQLSAEAFIIATGARWEAPEIPGYPADRILMPDDVQSLAAAPGSVVVLADGPGDVPFGAEYAVLLAAAGSEVTLVTQGERWFSALDQDVAPLARANLEALGVHVETGARITRGDAASVTLATATGERALPADTVLAADPRQAFTAALGLDAAGVHVESHVPVDRTCATNVPHIFAVGDVTGGAMLTNVAEHMGNVAGTNATGGTAAVRLARIPRLVHTFPPVGWVGLTEAEARAQGYDVTVGRADLAFNARSLSLGAREGAVKLVAERELGEILGVHVVGAGADEIITGAAFAIQSESPVDELAATRQWHPTFAEALGEAARQALR